MSNFVCSQ